MLRRLAARAEKPIEPAQTSSGLAQWEIHPVMKIQIAE